MNKLFNQNKKILVIGDIMLDIYHTGKTDRISPEAPVPVLSVTKTTNKLGGAANVANNISSLGANLELYGYIGDDHNGDILKDLLSQNNIEYDLLSLNNPTISKVRIIAGIQQIVRVDFEDSHKIAINDEDNLIEKLCNNIINYDIIVFSDYGKGISSERVCKTIIDIVTKENKILIIDPKGNNWNKYKGASIITPNFKELCDVYGSIKNIDEDIEKAGKQIINTYNLKFLLVTRSEKGMSFFENGNVHHIKSEATEVFDVSGAGDTVVATMATALASSLSWMDSVKLANMAAGIVVKKFGTAPITIKELEANSYEVKENNKILYLDNTIHSRMENIRLLGKKIIFTNGCFDIIHTGHIKYLQQAKSLGDILVIGLNSDASVKKLKGESRPIKDEEERALILSVMEFVDYIIIFNEDTPYNLLKEVQPDILVKGGDYKIEEIIGREFAKETVVIPFVDGFSTTSTIEKMKSAGK